MNLKELGIEENHATACKYIRDAAAQGAELAVLPEYVSQFHQKKTTY